MENTIDLKLILMGEGGVGKTSIVKAILEKEIPDDYLPTIGSSTRKKEYKLNGKNTNIKINIWDFGGQRSFNPINPAFYSNVDIALFVFDLTRPKETLENIRNHFMEIVNTYSEDFISLIVGNKLDVFSFNRMFKEAIKDYLNERDHFILTSAKTKENINECFELLIYRFLKRAELITPDLVQENTAEDFLKLVVKDELSLKNNIFTIKSADKIKENIRSRSESKVMASTEEEINELKYNEFIQQEIQKVKQQKDGIFDQFLINLSEFEKALNYIKKSRIKSTEEIINSLKNVVKTSKNDFEQNIELLHKLNREENELMIINSKLKNENREVNNNNSIRQNII